MGKLALAHLPTPLLYSRLNAWGRHRDMPVAPRQTFRQWYLEHRSRT
jgi:L-lactate dehydrogenase complex protein LldF